jgi:hypothetical protein
MGRRVLFRSLAVAGAALALSPFSSPPASAGPSPSVDAYQDRTFEAGSIIIPMDECHQYANSTDVAASRTAPRCYCPTSTSDDGVIKAYGLVYRLLENGITISVALSDSKTEISGVDFSITAPEPVKLFTRSSNSQTSFFKRGLSCANPSASNPNVKIDYRGAPFIIPAADAPRALQLIKDGTTTGTSGRGVFSASTFSGVDVHVAQTAFTARIARTYRGAPKPIALLNLDAGAGGSGVQSGINVLVNYLNAAGLNTTGAGGTACAPGTIYGTFSSNNDFLNDCLTTKDYATLWAPHWEAEGNTQLNQVLGKISAFVDSGKALFAECAAIATFEGAFNAPSWDSTSYSVTISQAKWTNSGKKVTVSGTSYPGAQVVIRKASSAAACTTTLGTVTANSSGAYTWTGTYSSSSAAPCRVTVDSSGQAVTSNVQNLTCSPASTAQCSVSTTFAGPTCGSVEIDTAANGHHHATNGVTINKLGGIVGTYGDGSSEGFVFRDVSNIYLQKGDLKFVNGLGTVRHWRAAKPPTCTVSSNTTGGTAGNSTYKAAVNAQRLISSCDGSDWNSASYSCLRSASDASSAYVDADSEWDVFMYAPHKDGVATKGPILYLGGHDYNGNPAGVRLVLNTVFNLQYEVEAADPPVPSAVVRSSPIVGPVDDIDQFVQGNFIRYTPDEAESTFDPADPAKFVFPYRAGHVYGYDVRNISTTATSYQALGAPRWDAAQFIPPANAAGCSSPFTSSCRTVFTNVAGGAAPARVLFDRARRSSFGSLLGGSLSATTQDQLIGLVLAGRAPAGSTTKEPTLGGVDRSTLALIEASPNAGPTRPKMIYVGALDGMLHAICAEVRGNCDRIGRELWAYIPRTQLGKLRQNTQKIQGSPKVADFLGDFDGQPGLEWRTVLVFQTGSGTAGIAADAPSVIAIDISNPANPKVLWEVSPTTVATTGQGVGLDVALAPVRIGSDVKPGVFVSTNNGGSGGSGLYVTALSAVDGSRLWAQPWTHVYPAPRSGGAGVPASGIPGGLALYDQTNTGSVDRIAVPSLYGDLWVLDAQTGASIYGSRPVFRFSQDKKPIGAAPAIYKTSGGAFYAVVASGGYVDDDGATWSSGQQYLVSVKLDIPIGSAPLSELGPDSNDRPWVVSINGNAYAQPTIAGGELFVQTASTDVNDIDAAAGTGKLYRVNLATGGSQLYTLGGSGASSIDFAGGVAFIAGLIDAMKIDVSSSFVAAGEATELQSNAKGLRRYWLSD